MQPTRIGEHVNGMMRKPGTWLRCSVFETKAKKKIAEYCLFSFSIEALKIFPSASLLATRSMVAVCFAPWRFRKDPKNIQEFALSAPLAEAEHIKDRRRTADKSKSCTVRG